MKETKRRSPFFFLHKKDCEILHLNYWVRFFKKECSFRIKLKGSKCYYYIKDGCSSIIGGESFNTMYTTILTLEAHHCNKTYNEIKFLIYPVKDIL